MPNVDAWHQRTPLSGEVGRGDPVRGHRRPRTRRRIAARAHDGRVAVGDVTADLAVDHWCAAPVLPLGEHRHAMRADADRHHLGKPVSPCQP